MLLKSPSGSTFSLSSSSSLVFVVPFAFIFVTAMKTRNEAALLRVVTTRRVAR